MSQSLTKVINIEDNNLFGSAELQHMENAFILTYVSPTISLPLIKDKVPEQKVLTNLATKANLKYENTQFYTLEGYPLNEKYVFQEIVESLCNTAEKVLNQEDDSKVFISNLAKTVIETKAIPQLETLKQSAPMSVEDLAAKLYSGKIEEKWGKSK